MKICSFGHAKLGYGMKFEQGILTTAEEQRRVRAATLRSQCMARLQISTMWQTLEFRSCFLYLEQFFNKLIETDDKHG